MSIITEQHLREAADLYNVEAAVEAAAADIPMPDMAPPTSTLIHATVGGISAAIREESDEWAEMLRRYVLPGQHEGKVEIEARVGSGCLVIRAVAFYPAS